MHPNYFLYSLLICLVAVVGLSGQSIEASVNQLYQVEENAPGFSLAVLKGDQIILEQQYGLANLDYDLPITAETVFDVGSIAKQFTAAAILLLEEAGKLSIKAPAYQYAPSLPRYAKG
ncbi:MAG: serine hydrolase domain-containing protein, partial [Bacteroidota bacterium]